MISVVVPVYNEADNIRHLFDELKLKISVPIEVLIVYDREDDNTIPAVGEILALYPFNIKLVKNNWGKGALNAIKTGFRESRCEAVLVVMADISDDLKVVDEMYNLLLKGYDVICGSRYIPGGKQIGGPFLKRNFSRVAGVSLHYLTGLPTHDVTNSFKMYSKRLLHSIDMESTGGFEIGMEITVKAFVKGYKVTELPTTWSDRVAGESRFKMWKWIPKYLHWYFYAFKIYLHKPY
jgi:dolichol-phosphate mannosyltransferase